MPPSSPVGVSARHRVPWALTPLGLGGDQLPGCRARTGFSRTWTSEGEVRVPGPTGLVVSLRGPLQVSGLLRRLPFPVSSGLGTPLAQPPLCRGSPGPNRPCRSGCSLSEERSQPSADGLWTPLVTISNYQFLRTQIVVEFVAGRMLGLRGPRGHEAGVAALRLSSLGPWLRLLPALEGLTSEPPLLGAGGWRGLQAGKQPCVLRRL